MKEAPPPPGTPRGTIQDHDYSRADVADLASVVASENPGKRLLVNVTIGHRSLAKRQAFVSQSIGVFFMLAIYVTERAAPSIELAELNFWALLGAINILIRAALFYKVFEPLPAQMARSSFLRVLPLLIVCIGASHWIWTIQLFVGPQLTLTVLVLFVGFLSITIAVMGMWPTVPIAAVLYVLTTWPPYFYRTYQVGLMPGSVLLMLMLGVAAVLWACIFLEINQVKSILTRSDEVELLVAKLNDTNRELTGANLQLDKMHLEAATTLETRSLFFTSASHDFRQRLHAMKLLSHSALERVSAGSCALLPSLKRLADSVEDVERYITDVLDFAKLESGSQTPTRSSVVLQQLFQELDLIFEDVAAECGVDLKFNATEVVLHTDPSMLLRVLENLVSNAIKFTSAKVLVVARRQAGGVAIQVWDQGCGISLEAQESVFAPFHQTHRASQKTGSRQGVGIGLAVVRRFVDTLGYQIQVRSVVGRGSVMTVLVPDTDVKQREDELA